MTEILLLVATLKKIAAIDNKLLQILGERKRIEKEHKQWLADVQKLERDTLDTKSKLADAKKRYQKEESRLKLERTGLEMRRGSLATLNNYKLQQAAEREIDHALTELGKAEEFAIEILSEADNFEGALKKLSDDLESKQAAFKLFEEDAKGTIVSLDEREARNKAERQELAAGVEKTALQTYERIRDKFPDSPIVPVKSGNCSSCFMSVGAQMTVQLLQGNALIRCRGCGRILFSDSEPE